MVTLHCSDGQEGLWTDYPFLHDCLVPLVQVYTSMTYPFLMWGMVTGSKYRWYCIFFHLFWWCYYFTPPDSLAIYRPPVPVSRTSVLSPVARLDSRHRPQTCHHPVTRRGTGVPAAGRFVRGGPARVDDSETIIHYKAATTTLQLQSVTEVASCLTAWQPSARHTAPVTQTPWNVTRRWRVETEWTLLPCSALNRFYCLVSWPGLCLMSG